MRPPPAHMHVCERAFWRQLDGTPSIWSWLMASEAGCHGSSDTPHHEPRHMSALHGVVCHVPWLLRSAARQGRCGRCCKFDPHTLGGPLARFRPGAASFQRLMTTLRIATATDTTRHATRCDANRRQSAPRQSAKTASGKRPSSDVGDAMSPSQKRPCSDPGCKWHREASNRSPSLRFQRGLPSMLASPSPGKVLFHWTTREKG